MSTTAHIFSTKQCLWRCFLFELHALWNYTCWSDGRQRELPIQCRNSTLSLKLRTQDTTKNTGSCTQTFDGLFRLWIKHMHHQRETGMSLLPQACALNYVTCYILCHILQRENNNEPLQPCFVISICQNSQQIPSFFSDRLSCHQKLGSFFLRNGELRQSCFFKKTGYCFVSSSFPVWLWLFFVIALLH